MFIVLLKFAAHRHRAGAFMEGHRSWIQRGCADGVFLIVGSLEPELGGAIVAHNTSRAALESRLAEDPFVAEQVVTPEILEITPTRADARVAFLQEQGS